MILERFAYAPTGTFGLLVIGDLELYTVERPWLDNQVGVSCVPEGEYSLEPHSTNRFPDTWALIGETVSHWPHSGKQRSAILFHAGNTMDDVRGCIAPGMFLNEHAWGVISSRTAMERLRSEMSTVRARRIVISQYRI